MQSKWIKAIKQNNGIASLTINRPEKRNAFNKEMITAFKQQLFEWSSDDAIHTLMINATGDCFCAGADIDWMQKAGTYDFKENVNDALELGRLLELLYHFPRPVITLVQGPAYGGALGIIAASDITVCTSDAKFCLSEVRIGLIPAVISPYVVEAIGLRQTRRYSLSAEVINAERALDLGLVHEIVDKAELSKYSDQFIKQLCMGSPKAQAQTKALLRYVRHKPIDFELVHYTAEAIAHARIAPQGQEGTTAFLEKRKPNWIL